MKTLTKNDEIFLGKLKTLGYEKGLEPKKVLHQHQTILKELIQSNLPDNTNESTKDLETIELNEVLKQAKEFYNNFFKLHDIYSIKKDFKGFSLSPTSNMEELNKEYESFLQLINPFDLPTELIVGHSMIGNLKKIIPYIQSLSENPFTKFPILNIELGDNLTNLSIATYIHEMSHAQVEDHKGYTSDYHNKEVLSIFLEKVAIDYLDKTGNLLRRSERMRFKDLSYQLITLMQYNSGMINLPLETAVQSSMYIESALKAEKLFDIYKNTNKEKNRQKIIYGIQDIFDGKIQIEELLAKNNITSNNSTDLSLIKRHIK